MSSAMNIALSYDGWNETRLRDMEVTAKLFYAKSNATDGYETLYEVKEPVQSYESLHIDRVTYSYVWVIVL